MNEMENENMPKDEATQSSAEPAPNESPVATGARKGRRPSRGRRGHSRRTAVKEESPVIEVPSTPAGIVSSEPEQSAGQAGEAEDGVVPDAMSAGAEATEAKAGKFPKKSRKSRSSKPRGQAAVAVPTESEEKERREGAVQKLLINAEEPEECRIAVVEDGKLEAFYVETVARERTKGNIYKGRITAIEPGLQAAFVEIGMTKHGFLPFGEIHPEYYHVEVDPETHWKDLKIQDVLRKGQEVLVQVVKEMTDIKGANVTTYLSLPGRYLVLMPGSDSAGISRKIEDETQRHHLRDMMNSLSLPEGIGYILRTASKEITKTALSKDLKFLLRLWEETKGRGQAMPSPALIYKDQDIVNRFLRDHFIDEIGEILVDNKDVYDQVEKFLNLFGTKNDVQVRLHKGSKPIFNQFNLEDQIEQIYQPRVALPSGGSIVINPTEALVAIDVNSGRTSKDKDFEQTISLVNMEAAAEMARQLRLRDLGGLIVVDFIDMREARHIREVEKQVKNSMKRDKAKVTLSRISKFGLMQISRQKLGTPIQSGSYNVCDHCQGRGTIRSVETLTLFYLRQIQTGLAHKKVERIACSFPMEVARYLLNNKRRELLDMEQQYGVAIWVESDPAMRPADHKIDFVKDQ